MEDLSSPAPGKALTCSHQRIGMYTIADRQFQGHRILAPLCIGKDVIYILARCVWRTCPLLLQVKLLHAVTSVSVCTPLLIVSFKVTVSWHPCALVKM